MPATVEIQNTGDPELGKQIAAVIEAAQRSEDACMKAVVFYTTVRRLGAVAGGILENAVMIGGRHYSGISRS